MMKPKVIKSANAKFWIDQQGIGHTNYNKDTSLTFDDAVNEVRIMKEMSGDKKIPVLVDINNVKSIPRESRVYYAGENAGKVYMAVALLIGSQTSRILGNFFLGLNKPKMPVKLFTSEEEALKWLEDFNN